MKITIEEIARQDGRYDPKALKFIYEGLGKTVQNIRDREMSQEQLRHITGQELATGLAELATERWGRLAKMVLNNWGVKTTRDLGEIVYLMISHNWMSAQETDTIEDFNNVFDFEDVFEKRYKLDINKA